MGGWTAEDIKRKRSNNKISKNNPSGWTADDIKSLRNPVSQPSTPNQSVSSHAATFAASTVKDKPQSQTYDFLNPPQKTVATDEPMPERVEMNKYMGEPQEEKRSGFMDGAKALIAGGASGIERGFAGLLKGAQQVSDVLSIPGNFISGIGIDKRIKRYAESDSPIARVELENTLLEKLRLAKVNNDKDKYTETIAQYKQYGIDLPPQVEIYDIPEMMYDDAQARDEQYKSDNSTVQTVNDYFVKPLGTMAVGWVAGGGIKNSLAPNNPMLPTIAATAGSKVAGMIPQVAPMAISKGGVEAIMAQKEGANNLEQFAVSLATGTNEAITELIPLDELLMPVKTPVAKGLIKKGVALLGDLTKNAALEGFQEFIVSPMDNAARNIALGKNDKLFDADTGIKDFAGGAAMGVALRVLGAAVGLGGRAGRMVNNRIQNKEPISQEFIEEVNNELIKVKGIDLIKPSTSPTTEEISGAVQRHFEKPQESDIIKVDNDTKQAEMEPTQSKQEETTELPTNTNESSHIEGLDIPEHTIEKRQHTKTNEDMWVLSLNDRVDKAEFDDIKAKIKAKGGYYSRYSKGFVFKSDPTISQTSDTNNSTYSNYTLDKDIDMTTFVDNATQKGRKDNKLENLYIGEVSTETADKINDLTNKEVQGFSHIITNDDIKHIFKHHGNEQTENARGQIAVTKEDFNKLPDVINNYDSIELAEDGKQGEKAIRYTKRINGHAIVTEMVSPRRGVLRIKTMWKVPTTTLDSTKHPAYVRNGSGLTPSNSSISSNEELFNGNTDEENISNIEKDKQNSKAELEDKIDKLEQKIDTLVDAVVNKESEKDVQKNNNELPEGTESEVVQKTTDGEQAGSDSRRNEREIQTTSHRDSDTHATNGTSTKGLPESSTVSQHEQRDGNTADKTNDRARNTSTKLGNYRITEQDNIGKGGKVTKYNDNIAAIKLVKTIINENRMATSSEQALLAKYVGWGGIPEAFNLQGKNTAWVTRANEIKSLLTTEEYQAARRSTQNAHYTSIDVIKGIYDLIKRLGFVNGTIIEPAMGVGNFFGAMPSDMMESSKLFGVELDPITGEIARQLYQNADIRINGFEKTTYPDNYFDLAIGNVPFADITILSDPKYKANKFYLHDYFFAKTLDKVSPGGLVAFISSKGTMDKSNAKVRKYLDGKANFLGAIRLASDAFKGNALTEVTTDLIILQKTGSDIANVLNKDNWLDTVEYEGVRINKYFADNPEMMLGTIDTSKSLYGGKNEYGLKSDGRSITDVLNKLPENIFSKQTTKHVPEIEIENHDFEDIKDGAYYIKDGMIYQRNGDKSKAIKTNTRAMKDFIGLKAALREVYKVQIENESDIALNKSQKLLNEKYDSFVKSNGYVNSKSNQNKFKEDPEYTLLQSLEERDGNSFKKADVFTKRTISYTKDVMSADTPTDALGISLNIRGAVDIDYIANLLGVNKKEAIKQLKGKIFKNPLTKKYEPEEQYLSGNVVAKLEYAKTLGKTYAENVEALRKVQPEPLKASEIDVNIGASWVDVEIYKEFMRDAFKLSRWDDINLSYNKLNGEWVLYSPKVSNAAINDKWGVKDDKGRLKMNGIELIKRALNSQTPNITKPGPGDKRIADVLSTEKAKVKIEELNEAFKSFVFKNRKVRQLLTDKYNRTFNNTVNRKYTTKYMTFPGINPKYELRDFQANAVSRIVQGNTLLAHPVGAGKTFEMIAGAMELKRLGVIKKPMFVVPNHKASDFLEDFHKLYANSNVLMLSEKEMSKEKRRMMLGRVANSNFDVVIIRKSSFEFIPVSKKTMIQNMKEEIKSVSDAIIEAKGSDIDNRAIKQLEKTKQRLEEKLKALQSKPKDNVVTFEEMGIDALFVDEAHNYKNLFTYTKHTRVPGISTINSGIASDMYMKTKYINKIGGRLVFATATPISNSMSEMYTMFRYVRPDILNSMGMNTFDSWASIFGKITTTPELAPDGSGFRNKSRFAQFVNVPELGTQFREFADVIEKKDLPLKLPKLRTGKMQLVEIEPSDILDEYKLELMNRSKEVKSGTVDPAEDNFLNITNDGKIAALDLRFIENQLTPGQKAELVKGTHDTKLNECSKKVVDIFNKTKKQKGTQLIFLDRGTPGKGNNTYNFAMYEELRKELVKNGIPRDQIEFIHDHNSTDKKKVLFDKVRKGDTRVLIGSTSKMGEGMNVQDRVAALHHLDVPWRPSDIEQRNGRIVRQGNQFDEVDIFVYATSNSFDSVSWQTVQRKAKFIDQVMTNNLEGRAIEDIDESAASYEEIMAITSGNPKILEKIKLDNEIRSLSIKKKTFLQDKFEAEDNLATIPDTIQRLNTRIDVLTNDKSISKSTKGDKFTMTIKGETIDNRKDAGEKIKVVAKNTRLNHTRIGEFGGFELFVDKHYDNFGNVFNVILKGKGSHSITVSYDDKGLSVARQLENVINSIPKELVHRKVELQEASETEITLKEIVVQEFKEESKLKKMQERQAQLMAELSADEKKVPPQFEGREATPENDPIQAAKHNIKNEGGFIKLGDKVPMVDKYEYADEDLELQKEEAKLKPKTFIEKIDEWSKEFKKMSTRTFRELDPKNPLNSEAIKELVKYPQLKGLAGDEATRILHDIIKHDKQELTPEEFNRFERYVLLLDLREEAKLGHNLPGLWTEQVVAEELERLENSLNDNIKEAVKRRKDYWEDVKDQYIENMELVGYDVSNRFQKLNYFRHMVLEYANAKKVTGSGSKVKVNANRGFSKERKGSNKLINEDYLQAEYEVLAHMIYDTKVAQMLSNIRKNYDIKGDLKKAARDYNRAAKDANHKQVEAIVTAEALQGNEKLQEAYNAIKRNIALGFKTLRAVANSEGLPTFNGEYEDTVDALANGYSDDSGKLGKYLSLLTESDNEEAAKGALTIFKYGKQKDEFAQALLGDKYKSTNATWKDAIPEGYEIWQPIPGKHFFTANSISADFAEAIIEKSFDGLKQSQMAIREVMAMGGDREQFVLPESIAKSLDSVYKKINDNNDPIHQGISLPLNLWKAWVLTGNPKQVVKYNIRNTTGDLDGVIAAAGFKAISPKYVNKATKDLYNVMKHMKFTPELLEWRDRGGFQSLLYVQEIANVNDMKMFRNFRDIKNETLLTKMRNRVPFIGSYTDFTQNLTNYRESILRYSTYLFYKEHLKANNGSPKFYGASLKSRIDGLNKAEDKAYQLSKDALGAYDELTEVGQVLRRYLIPFHSWNEVNMKRYKRIFENTVNDIKVQKEVGDRIVKGMRLSGVTSVKAIRILGKTGIRVMFLAALLQAWNKLVMGDDDDKLPESIQNTPHITLGSNSKGEVIYFSRLGALNDVMEWFGLDQLPSDIKDLTSGRKTIGEQAKQMVLAPINKIVNSFTPYLKMPVEILSKRSYFPDFTEPRVIRDVPYYIAQSFGVKDEYAKLAGMPMNDSYLETWQKAFIYKSDPEVSAYYKALDLRYKFEEKVLHKQAFSGFSTSEKSKALYYYKTALKYGDTKVAEKFLEKYVKYGGTSGGLSRSLVTLDPLYGLDDQEKNMFASWLTDKELEQVIAAIEYYTELVQQ